MLTAGIKNMLRKLAVLAQAALIVSALSVAPGAAAENVSGPAADTAPPSVALDVVPDPVTGEEAATDIYALTVNGETLEWDQKMKSAALFCEQNGLPMVFFDEDRSAHEAGGQSIRFAGLIDLDGIYLRTGVNTANLIEIELEVKQTAEAETAALYARDAYRKLLKKFGAPSKSIRIFDGSDWTKFGEDDFGQAVETMAALPADFCFVWAEFSNLDLAVARHTLSDSTRFYSIQISLSPW